MQMSDDERERLELAEAALRTVKHREKYELSWIDTVAYERWKEAGDAAD